MCLCRCSFSSSAWQSLFTILSAVFVDFLAIGLAIATVGWCANSHIETLTILLGSPSLYAPMSLLALYTIVAGMC